MGIKNWFLGAFFSLYLHGMVVLLVLLIGVSPEIKPKEPTIIHGELISMSSLAGNAKAKAPPKTQAAKPKTQTTDVVPEPKPEPKPEEKDPEAKVVESSPKPSPIKETKEPEKIVKETKPEQKPVKTETVKKDVVPLKTVKKDDKKKQTKTEKKPPPKKPEKKPEKKVAKKITPKPTPKQKPKPSPKTQKAKASPAPKKKNEFEIRRNKLLNEMQTKRQTNKQKAVIEDIQKNVRNRGVATADGGGRSGSYYGSPDGYSSYVQIVREYSGKLYEEISRRWEIPTSIPRDGSLRAEIVFRIDGRGRVNGAQVRHSSGNHTFDQFCIQAIYKAAPLTRPPPELLEEARARGIVVKFTNKSL